MAEYVPAVMQQNSTCSVTWHAIALQIYSKFLQIILHKVHIALKLNKRDKAAHVNFCRQFLNFLDNDNGILDVLIMLAEAHFHLLSNVGQKENNRTSGI
jgi:hypothetical protein